MDLADQGFLAHCCLCRRQPSYNEKRTFHPRAGPADISRNVNVAGGLRSAGTNGRKAYALSCHLPVRKKEIPWIPCRCRPCAADPAPCRQRGLTAQDRWCGESYVGDGSALITQTDGWPRLATAGWGGSGLCKTFTSYTGEEQAHPVTLAPSGGEHNVRPRNRFDAGADRPTMDDRTEFCDAALLALHWAIYPYVW